MGPADFESAMNVMNRVDPNPFGLAKRAVGLGAAEQEEGVPKWCWALIGFLGGAIVYREWGGALEKKIRGRR
jgi:hypothetical protein